MPYTLVHGGAFRVRVVGEEGLWALVGEGAAGAGCGGGGGPPVLLFVCVEGVVGQGGLIRRTTQRMVARIVKSFAEGTWLLVGI